MPKSSRVSQFAIAGLLIAMLVLAGACRGQPTLPTGATRTPTKAATVGPGTPAAGATAPAGRTTAGAATVAVVATGVAPVATAAAGTAPAGTGAPGTAGPKAPVVTPASGTAGPQPTGTAVPGTAPTPAGTRVAVPILTEPGGQTGGGTCAAFDSGLQVSSSATQVKVDQPVTITATLTNNGCGTLGWPQYYLGVNSHDGFGAVLQPWHPAATSHGVGVNQGQADTAVWVLQASNPGEADVTVSVVFQAQTTAGSPGSWMGASAKPVKITVTQ